LLPKTSHEAPLKCSRNGYTKHRGSDVNALTDTLLTDARPQVVADCVELVQTEVGSKSGLSGLAIKGAFSIVQKIKPGIIHEAVDSLLNELVAQLEPFYTDDESTNQFESLWTQRSHELASALLGVTDIRIARARNRTIKKAYEKLRPSGIKHVEAAVPGIARVIRKHVQS